MMKALALSTLLFSATAFAHVEPGTYNGKSAKGETCTMSAGKTYFENGAHHPLNERIKITVNGTEFTVGHPSIIDTKVGEVTFNHDFFHGVSPTSTGAKALVVDMLHTEEKEGPVRFTLIESNWKTGESLTLVCSDIALVP